MITTDSFGTRYPGKIWQLLIRLCHKPEGPWTSRLLAPVVRKAVTRIPSMLPVDVSVDGMNLRCRFIDNYSEKKFVFTPWRYHKQERELLVKTLESGGTFIDIGANVGIYVLTAAKAMAGREGRIIAFEPNPETHERLIFNLRANIPDFEKQTKITVFNIGVADRDSTFTMKIDASNLGASSIRSRNRQKKQKRPGSHQTVEIRCRPLLDVLKDLSITTIDALKIDIEGAEDLALMPFLEQAPDSQLPRLVLIENSENLWDQDLFGRMAGRGYRKLFQNRENTVFCIPSIQATLTGCGNAST